MGSGKDQENGTNKSEALKTKQYRIAYSINNYQPVLCTHIHDQPFFYMDDEDLFEEENILNDEDYAFLEKEIGLLQDKMNSCDQLSFNAEKAPNETLLEFMADSYIISELSYTPEASNIIERLEAELTKSRMALQMLNFAKDHDVTISCSNQIQTSFFDKQKNVIFIRDDINFVDQVLLTIKLLRQHWQYRQGSDINPLSFYPDHAVLINRSQQADLSLAIIRCAWELKLYGHNEFWARVENSSLSDLGRALAREAVVDFRTLNNGKASAAVFETWFLSERCKQEDKKLIQNMLADETDCALNNAEVSTMVSMDLISALGEQPFGKNYLAPYIQMIMNDPLFTDVRDRSNANFLWFIKFERSFNETEAELHSIDKKQTTDMPFQKDQLDDNNIVEDTQNAFSKENSPEEIWSKAQLRRSIFGKQDEYVSEGNIIFVEFGGIETSSTGI
jgi:hypothetical protein